MMLDLNIQLELQCSTPGDATFDSEEAMKEWLWEHQKDTIYDAMKVGIHHSNENFSLARKLQLLDTIARVQRQYLQMEEAKVVFGNLLSGLLDLMDSEYGFIGEVKHEEDGTMYLQTHAYTNIAWNEETRAFYEENAARGLRFYNMDSLIGKVMTTKEPVISNNPRNDSRSGGIPQGHPPVNQFLGIPFFEHGTKRMVGMVGIANKAGGYTESHVAFLEPFVLTCSNLIQTYAAVQENKRLINSLEKMVAERTRKLEVALSELEEANRRVVQTSTDQMTHFACMSHELRTPLNCVVGLSSVLRESELNSMQRDSLNMIIASGELLGTIVNDILDFSKLESGNVDIILRRTNLQDTLNAVVQAIEMKADARKITIQTSYKALVPKYFETDEKRLQQILYNLLGNAIKFSNENAVVEFTVEVVSGDTIADDCSRPSPGMSKNFSLSPTSIVDKAKDSHDAHDSIIQLTEGNASNGAMSHDSRYSNMLQTDAHDNVISSSDSSTSKVLGTYRCPFHRSQSPTSQRMTKDTSDYPVGTTDRCPFSRSTKQPIETQDGTNEEQRDSCLEESSSKCHNDQLSLKSVKNGARLKKTSKEGDVLRFVVKDYGRGIAKTDFQKIFQPFQQANSDTERLYGGTGLGLAITSRLVERLGGTLIVESELGEWAKFTVEFPAKDVRADIDGLAKKLENAQILHITRSQNNADENLLRSCRVPVERFSCCSDMTEWLSQAKERDRSMFFFILVHEDIHCTDTIKHFVYPGSSSACITFGSKCSASAASFHFRKLSHLIPSVLLETLISVRENANRGANTLTRTNSRNELECTDLRVLIAEDNVVNQKVLFRMLTRLGIENIDIANSGKEAVTYSSNNHYSIIFMDMQMPIMDGIEACKIIVGNRGKENAQPKVVFVTAHALSDFQIKAMDAGADGFITKPFSIEKIRDTLLKA